MLLLDKPVEQSNDVDGPKYCHLYCGACGPPLAVCGAYKPIPCGGSGIDLADGKPCGTCGKVMCLDCYKTLEDPCARCGL